MKFDLLEAMLVSREAVLWKVVIRIAVFRDLMTGPGLYEYKMRHLLGLRWICLPLVSLQTLFGIPFVC